MASMCISHHLARVGAASVEQRQQVVQPGDEGFGAALRGDGEGHQHGAAAEGVLATGVQTDLTEQGVSGQG